jgi:hypothetical protein
MSLTAIQRQVFAAVVRATRVDPATWCRARDKGERVTLASLWRQGLLDRRAWRGAEGEVGAAHEYRASKAVLDALAELG